MPRYDIDCFPSLPHNLPHSPTRTTTMRNTVWTRSKQGSAERLGAPRRDAREKIKEGPTHFNNSAVLFLCASRLLFCSSSSSLCLSLFEIISRHGHPPPSLSSSSPRAFLCLSFHYDSISPLFFGYFVFLHSAVGHVQDDQACRANIFELIHHFRHFFGVDHHCDRHPLHSVFAAFKLCHGWAV